jgi:hypothetical protein
MAASRRGASRLGCLFTLLLLATATHYAVNIGGAYLRYWRMRDAMHGAAEFASNLNDDAIRQRLTATADSLGLPADAQIIRIKRGREIVISTNWDEGIELPFYRLEVTFHPVERATL